jgi:hypothetical protein
MENDFTIRTQINVAVLHGSIGACGFSRGYLLTMQNTLWGFSGETVRSPAGNGNCIAAEKKALPKLCKTFHLSLFESPVNDFMLVPGRSREG